MFRAMVDNAPEHFVIVSRDGTISFMNYALPGHRIEDVIGTIIYDYVMPEKAGFYRQFVESAFQTGEPRRIDAQVIMDRLYDCRAAPLEREGKDGRA